MTDLGSQFSNMEEIIVENEATEATPADYLLDSFNTEHGISDHVLNKFSEYFDQLANNPAEFQYIAKKMIFMLQVNVNDSNTLWVIVDQIVSRAITADNHAYIGAKLCHEILASGLNVGEEKFEDMLLNYCNELFREILAQHKQQADRHQAREVVRGFTRFYAELYSKLKIENGESGEAKEAYNVIGLGLENLLQYFGGTKTDVDILFMSQILKLVGWQLDHAKDEDGLLKPNLDSIFRTLQNDKESATISQVSRGLIDDLEALRERDWDHEVQSSVSDHASEPESPTQVYELSDELYLEGLSYFDFEEHEEDRIYLDDEPDFVEAAYDEFIADLNEKLRIRGAAPASDSEESLATMEGGTGV